MTDGLLLNITGNGKGKTTSALGSAVRALGRGWKVVFFQFVKSDMPTGEKMFFAKLASENMHFEQLGDGFSWQKGDHACAAEAGWRKVLPYLRGESPCDLLILDELNVALDLKWLDAKEVAEALAKRPKPLNVMITGRNTPPELEALSDLVSRVENVRHPFDRGIPARPGIDF